MAVVFPFGSEKSGKCILLEPAESLREKPDVHVLDWGCWVTAQDRIVQWNQSNSNLKAG